MILDLAERGIAKVEPIDEYNNDDPYFDAFYNDDDNIYEEPVKEENDKQFDLELKTEPSESRILEGLELNEENFEEIEENFGEILKSDQKEKR